MLLAWTRTHLTNEASRVVANNLDRETGSLTGIHILTADYSKLITISSLVSASNLHCDDQPQNELDPYPQKKQNLEY